MTPRSQWGNTMDAGQGRRLGRRTRPSPGPVAVPERVVAVPMLAASVGIPSRPYFRTKRRRACSCGIPGVRGPPLDVSIQSQAGDRGIFIATQAQFAGSEKVYERAQDSLGGARGQRTSGAQ